MLLRLLLVVAVLAPAIAMSPTPIFACICGDERPTVAEEFEWAEVVFRGKVIATDGAETTMLVLEVWKGEAAFELTLRNVSSCSYPSFEEGVEYVVYALEGSAFQCGLTGPVQNRRPGHLDQLDALRDGVGQEMYPNTGNGGLADPVAGPDRLTPLLVVGLITVLILGLTGARLLNRRHANRRAPTTVDRT